MYKIVFTKRFQRDYKVAKRRGLDSVLLNNAIKTLASGIKLPSKNKDHLLKGTYKGLRECHIQPDWLLVYHIDKDKKVLNLIRTGSHADLFQSINLPFLTSSQIRSYRSMIKGVHGFLNFKTSSPASFPCPYPRADDDCRLPCFGSWR
jgi:mRNA interferase YafQ